MQFEVFYCNDKYSTYHFDHLSMKEIEQIWCMRFPAKVVAIYTSKKIEFDSKNNDRDGESV